MMHSPPYCPLCQSSKVATRNWARKAAGTIGSLAGAASGIAGALRSAQIGATAGLVAGPAGSVVGGFAGAVLGGLAASAIGCELGSSVGQAFDTHVLENYQCKSCGHTFHQGKPSAISSK